MSASTAALVRSACDRIAPLWSLKNFVAVNPFVGLSDLHFIDTALLMQRVGHGEVLMPGSFYLEAIASGRIGENEFREAMKIAGETLPHRWAQSIDFSSLEELGRRLAESASAAPTVRVRTFADWADDRDRAGWPLFIVEEISKWCSAYFDQGQSSWKMPWRGLGLFAAWREAARIDANPELMGLGRFREFVTALPDDPLEWIEASLKRMRVPETLRTDFLHRQLMSISGWSGYAQFLTREGKLADRPDNPMVDLLAIRLVYDAALFERVCVDDRTTGAWRGMLDELERDRARTSPDLLVRFIAQQALECGFQNESISKLGSAPRPGQVGPQKALQAIFCIDVRSEVFRRSLEAQSDEIETIGFAGFFGFAFEYLKFGEAVGGAQCPVLVSPKIRLREAPRRADPEEENRLLRKWRLARTLSRAWNSFKTSAVSCFSFVEAAGFWFGVRLVKDSLGRASPASDYARAGARGDLGPKVECEGSGHEACAHAGVTGMGMDEQVALAEGALKNMGLTSDFAKVVLFCGHGSASSNNPYGSSLDCGACGGHAGDANARVAAEILNRPEVREELKRRGIRIAEGTLFVAGLHNTTTDEVLLYDCDELPAGSAAEMKRVREWLAASSQAARRERSAMLGLADIPEADREAEFIARSRDWSQVRPEWGLAGNASFIAAPRERTRGSNLGGRAFLHSYRASGDPGQATLELILAAPMVVASWINLQYYASTVNNRLFGSGNKALHNVVGTFGVWQGNGGDLQVGLPLQSLHYGARWVHEPLRLSVFIEAEPDALQGAISRQPGVRELLDNGWVTLFAMDASGRNYRRYCAGCFRECPKEAELAAMTHG